MPGTLQRPELVVRVAYEHGDHICVRMVESAGHTILLANGQNASASCGLTQPLSPKPARGLDSGNTAAKFAKFVRQIVS